MTDALTIKLSTEADRQRIRDLAELDSRSRARTATCCWPRCNGRLVAAIGMDGSGDRRPVRAHRRRS